MNLQELDTPAILVDLPALRRNIQRMADFCRAKGINLRPHVKVHRATPQIARLQMEAGAIGLTCAKVNEAEVLVDNGFNDILIANQIVTPAKIQRLVDLARRSRISVAADDAQQVEALSRAAREVNATLGVVVEVDIGHHRCGVLPMEPAAALARCIQRSPNLEFRGLLGYDGHCTTKVNAQEREQLSLAANRWLGETAAYLSRQGMPCEIVSAGGSFTYAYAAQIPGITEVQPGTYALMDTAFRDFGIEGFERVTQAAATIISVPQGSPTAGLAVMDLGAKAFSLTYGLPEVVDPSHCRVMGLSDEHGRLIFGDTAPQPVIGDAVRLWVQDVNGTINLTDRLVVMEDGQVVDIWQIPNPGDHR